VQIDEADDARRTRGTFGLGYIGERFVVDYAFQSLEGASAHRFQIRWR
jgi:hypothetical protein